MRSASLIASFRSSIARPTDAPVYASTETSRPPSQNSGSGWIRCSFPVGLFHPLQHAGLSRRTPGRMSKTAPLVNSPGVRRGESSSMLRVLQIQGFATEARKYLDSTYVIGGELWRENVG